jgi:hypothetical protein
MIHQIPRFYTLHEVYTFMFSTLLDKLELEESNYYFWVAAIVITIPSIYIELIQAEQNFHICAFLWNDLRWCGSLSI